jgi:hypothetical protein
MGEMIAVCPCCGESIVITIEKVAATGPDNLTREQLIAGIERAIAAGRGGYRTGRRWGKDSRNYGNRSTAQLRSIYSRVTANGSGLPADRP